MAAGTDDGRILLCNHDDGSHVELSGTHGARVTGLALDPTRCRLLSVGLDRTIRIWDLRTHMESRRLEGHRVGVQSVTIAPSGDLALTSGRDGTVRSWQIGG